MNKKIFKRLLIVIGIIYPIVMITPMLLISCNNANPSGDGQTPPNDNDTNQPDDDQNHLMIQINLVMIKHQLMKMESH